MNDLFSFFLIIYECLHVFLISPWLYEARMMTNARKFLIDLLMPSSRFIQILLRYNSHPLLRFPFVVENVNVSFLFSIIVFIAYLFIYVCLYRETMR